MLATTMTAEKFTSAADQEANVGEFVHPNTCVYSKNGPKADQGYEVV